MDPISAFAAAQTALGLIRKGVDFYKECKAASADVGQITSEVSGHIGKFLDAKSVVQEAARKAKEDSEDPESSGDLNSQALNRHSSANWRRNLANNGKDSCLRRNDGTL